MLLLVANEKALVEDVNWPPRSPYEALVSSPSGRKKAQEMLHRRRHAEDYKTNQHGSPSSGARANRLPDNQGENVDDEVRDDDDEETLQLKLAAIEARLKLKKLQQNKPRPQSSTSEFRPQSAESSKPHPTPKSPPTHYLPRNAASPARKPVPEQEDVQVLVSPSKRLERAADPASPKRRMLGIDKGVRGSDVSLKWRSSGQKDGWVTRNRNDGSDNRGAGRSKQSTQSTTESKPTSFTDRVLEQRSADKAKREKSQNMHIKKNSRFAVDRKEIESFQAAASATEPKASHAHTPVNNRRRMQEFSRDDVMSAYHRPNSSSSRNNKSIHDNADNKPMPQSSSSENRHAHRHQAHSTANSLPRASEPTSNGNDEAVEQTDEKTPDSSKFEAFSGLHLSKRILPYSFLKRTLAEATSMRIPDLLRTIKPPNFDPPETDGDYVVFGVVASKSSPRDHKGKQNATAKEKDPFDDGSNNNSKYMVLTLTDLKWSMDLFLFATAFPRYYKLSPGTVIAILNPSIMPPPPQKIDTNAFSLTVSSSDDTILEIGASNDIGFCKSVKKDGEVCGSWVDARKTEFCDFHVELQLRKTKAGRMGVNSGAGILGDRGGGRGTGGGRHGGGGRGAGGEDGLKSEGGVYDRSTGSTYYVTPSAGRGVNPNSSGQRSAADLIDADDPFMSPSGLHGGAGNKEERFRKRMVEQQKERDIAKRLGEFNSVGSEYLRAHQSQTLTTTTSSSATTDPHANRNSTNTDVQGDSATNGLDNLSRNANDVKLSRAKKRNLEPDKDTPRSANVGKKTRFITSKGIREAGRDSLGDTTMTRVHDDDDDDDLDIV